MRTSSSLEEFEDNVGCFKDSEAYDEILSEEKPAEVKFSEGLTSLIQFEIITSQQNWKCKHFLIAYITTLYVYTMIPNICQIHKRF